MLRYFFDIHDGIVAQNLEGTELPDHTAARAKALQVASAYAGNPAMLNDNGGAIVVTVRDDNGQAMTARLMLSIEAASGAAGRLSGSSGLVSSAGEADGLSEWERDLGIAAASQPASAKQPMLGSQEPD